MNRKQIVLFSVLALVAGLIAVLALRNPQAPFLPPDEDHAVFLGGDTCFECHGPDAPAPQSDTHPVGSDCMRCHGRS